MRRPPAPPRPTSPPRPVGDLLARALAARVRDTYGEGQAATLDLSDELGAPRGWVGTRNIALDRALGTPGLPLGRLVEVSGWEAAGKSTMADQILAQAQAEGGIGVMADTERARDRTYMAALGAIPESTIWLGGRTVEDLFDEAELLIRNYASLNALAWWEALSRVGVKCERPPTYTYTLTEFTGSGKDKKRKTIASHTFHRWSRTQAGALLQWQEREGLPPSSIRDLESRARLRPVVIYTEAQEAKAVESERKAHLSDWEAGNTNPYCQPADRPMVWVWDSVAGTPTKAELEGQAGDSHPADAAKVIRQSLRRLVQLIDDEAVLVLLVNQRYEKLDMGGFRGRGGGGGSETYGGGGIKYHTSVRIELSKTGSIKPPGASDDDGHVAPIGQIVKIRVPKNKVQTPFHEEEFGLVYGRGADNSWALFEDFKKRGIIRVGGGWSSFSDPTILDGAHKSFRGWTDLSNMLAEDLSLWEKLRAIFMEGR